jgi:uncharacterized protein DUF3570
MQLESPDRSKSVREKIGAAACLLLASGAPGRADTPDSRPSTQLDVTGLFYDEASRVGVVEPMARITRLYPDGQTLFIQLGIDAITGASPTGALPSGQTQTTTSASGRTTTRAADQIPTTKFNDTRFAYNGGWVKPFGRFTSTLETEFSREKDYRSLGASGKLSVDLFHHMTTLTFGAGVNHDAVFPVGGTPDGLSDPGKIISTRENPKNVTTGMIGLSRVLTRRWMMAVNVARTSEQGYLTEPYKLLSLVDGTTGLTVGDLTDKRPSSRDRTSVLVNSVYHLTEDVLYASYRYYWDDWNVRSHTFDLKYRHDLDNHAYLEPHLRYYTQTSADFFRSGLIEGDPLPAFATSDYRLGPLNTVTAGATYGFRILDYVGDWSVRAEYIGQFGNSHPSDAVGAQRKFDLYPPVNTISVVVSYSIKF